MLNIPKGIQKYIHYVYATCYRHNHLVEVVKLIWLKKMSISEHVNKVNKLIKCYNLPIYIK